MFFPSLSYEKRVRKTLPSGVKSREIFVESRGIAAPMAFPERVSWVIVLTWIAPPLCPTP